MQKKEVKKKPAKVPSKISDLKASKKNPRTISSEALSGLSSSIKAFGDLSGIVFNRKLDRLTAGHQRVKALTALYGEMKIEYDAKEKDQGWLTTKDGSRFSVRIVDWDESIDTAANISANNPEISGEFTDDLATLLQGLKIELPELWGDLRLNELMNELHSIEDVQSSENVATKNLHEVVVECANESEQEEIYNRFIGQGLRCRLLTL